MKDSNITTKYFYQELFENIKSSRTILQETLHKFSTKKAKQNFINQLLNDFKTDELFDSTIQEYFENQVISKKTEEKYEPLLKRLKYHFYTDTVSPTELILREHIEVTFKQYQELKEIHIKEFQNELLSTDFELNKLKGFGLKLEGEIRNQFLGNFRKSLIDADLIERISIKDFKEFFKKGYSSPNVYIKWKQSDYSLKYFIQLIKKSKHLFDFKRPFWKIALDIIHDEKDEIYNYKSITTTGFIKRNKKDSHVIDVINSITSKLF